MQGQPHNRKPSPASRRRSRVSLRALGLLLTWILSPPSASWAAPPCKPVAITALSPLPTAQDLLAAAFAAHGEDRVMVVAGRGGAMHVSRDDGQTFTAAALPDDARGQDWVEAFAPAPGVFVLVAESGAMVRSDDLGTTWKALSPPAGVSGPASWLDARTAFIAPAGMHTARTVDGGVTWETIAHEQTVRADVAAAFADAQRGAAVGRSGLSTTQDGGRSWQAVSLTGGRPEQLYAVAFDATGDYGVASGAGVLYHTRDRGRTWRAVSLDERAPLVSLSLPDTDTIYALADNGALWRSFDQGTRFELVELPDGDVTDVAFADRRVGVVTGAAGALLLTRDAGDTWVQLRQGTGRTLLAVVALGDDRAAGSLLAVGLGGAQLETRDGVHWGAPDGASPTLYDVAYDGVGALGIAPRGVAYGAVATSGVAWTEGAGVLEGDIFSQVVARASGEFYVTSGGVLYRAGASGEPVPVALPEAGEGPPEVLTVAVWSGTLFVATRAGVYTSSDGAHFAPLGPPGVSASMLAPVSTDSAIARIQGGLLVTLQGDQARVEGIPEGFPLLAARLDDAGRSWVGAAHGLVLQVDPALTGATVTPLGVGVEDAVVALDVAGPSGVALTSSGRVFAMTGSSWGWVAETGWSEAAAQSLGRGDPRSNGVGALVRSGDALYAVGPGGQGRKLSGDLTASTSLSLGVSADLSAGWWAGGVVFLGGSGRTVLSSEDDGSTWHSWVEDLAPERVTGLQFEAIGRGLVVTDSGRVLRMRDAEEGVYEVVAREPAPIADLRAAEGALWLANGAGELVVSDDGGETWELSELPPLQGAVQAFDVRGARLLAVSAGELRVASRDEDVLVWGYGLEGMSSVVGVFGASGSGQALALTSGGQALQVGLGRSECWALSSPVSVRDALPYGGGWVLVGDGGLVAQLSGAPAPGAR